MFKFIRDFFSSESTWYDYHLYEFLKKWSRYGNLPYDYLYPKKILLNSLFWERILTLKKHTDSDKHERAVSVYWIDGDWVFLDVIRGNKSSVTSKYSITVKYIPSTKEYYNKVVYSNGKQIFKRAVFYKKLPQKIEIFKMFGLHTHPPHEYITADGGTSSYYSFFSLTDVNSLILDTGIMAGLIADKVYFLAKTDQSPKFKIKAQTISKRWLIEHHFVLYQADFKEKTFKKILL